LVVVGGGDEAEDLDGLLPLRVTARRSWANWVAAAKSTQDGAVATLMVQVALRPCSQLVVVFLGKSFQGRFLEAWKSLGWLPLRVKT
jgi:hypothetical protein